MNQQELEARLAAIAPGGDTSRLRFTESREKVTVMETPPGGLEPVKIEKEVPVRTWYDPTNGRAVKVRVNDDGTYEKTYDGTDTGLIDKSGASGAQPPREEVNPNDPSRMRRWNPQANNGQGAWEDAGPNNTAPATPAKPLEQKDEGGRRYVWQPNPGGPNAGGKWVDVGNAPETPAERQAREANAPTQTVRTENGGDGKPYTIITIVPKPGQPGQPGQIVLGPDGKVAPGGVPGKPAQEKKETVTVNGKVYIQVSKQNPDGTVELYHTDQQGNRVALPDMAPDQPSTAGPALPQFVLGHSEAALRKYKQDLQEGVAKGLWSQKWANERWGEALQVADVVVKDAATQQRDIESRRNDQYSRATQSLNFMQNTTQQAFNTVEKLNGLLPAGSNLGGQAFAAMLGLSMMQMALSGINRRPDEPQPQAPTPPTLTDLNNPDALAAKRQQIMTHPVFRPSQPVTNAQDAALRPSAPAAGAVPPVRPAAAPSAPVPATLPPNRPDQTQVGAQIDNAISPPASTSPAVPPQPSPPAYGKPAADPSFTSVPAENPGGGHVLPAPNPALPVNIPYPSSAPAESRTPSSGSDYPVLAALQMPSFAFNAPQPSADPYPAQLYSQAASKAPWEMSPDEIQHYTDMGIPDSVIWSVPSLTRGNAA